MGARKRYPEFDGLTRGEMAALIAEAKIHPLQRRVAECCLVERMLDVETAAEVGYDRRTVARWMERDILPEIRRMLGKVSGAA